MLASHAVAPTHPPAATANCGRGEEVEVWDTEGVVLGIFWGISVDALSSTSHLRGKDETRRKKNAT
eukprot:9486121-Pyramimonas_sp.AAC.1